MYWDCEWFWGSLIVVGVAVAVFAACDMGPDFVRLTLRGLR